MTLTKADAARQLGISRTTLYKFIEQGKVSATPDGLIDQAELLRVAPTMDVHRARHSTPMDSTHLDAIIPNVEHAERAVDSVNEHATQASTARQLTSTLEAVVDILREQLQAAQEREALLLRLLHEAQQRVDRLLEAPRPAAPTPQAPRVPPPRAPVATARGAMRRRIIDLLQDHPEGLSPAQVQRRLGVEKSLANTILAMQRDGLVQRVGHGRYVITRTRDET